MWVTLGTCHLNMDHYSEFTWYEGTLKLFIADQYAPKTEIADPDAQLYRYLCEKLGIDPALPISTKGEREDAKQVF